MNVETVDFKKGLVLGILVGRAIRSALGKLENPGLLKNSRELFGFVSELVWFRQAPKDPKAPQEPLDHTDPKEPPHYFSGKINNGLLREAFDVVIGKGVPDTELGKGALFGGEVDRIFCEMINEGKAKTYGQLPELISKKIRKTCSLFDNEQDLREAIQLALGLIEEYKLLT